MKPNYEALELQLLNAQTFASEVRKAFGLSEFTSDDEVSTVEFNPFFAGRHQ